MKKLLSLTLLAAFALDGIAVAQSGSDNTYSVTGKVTGGKGTKAKPKPVSVKFGYDVGSATAGNRPGVVTKYKIDLYGVKVDNTVAKTCTADQINRAQSDDVCAKGSLVGSGTIANKAGATTNPADTSITCNLQLKVYNSGKAKGALFIYRTSATSCPVAISQALPISYVKGSGGGTALQFTIPSNLVHPLPGIDNAVVHVDSTIKKITKGGKGYYSSIACKGSKRPVTVTFSPESGGSKTATSNAGC